MAKQKITYEEAMTEIEHILADLRSGECGVDRLSAEVKRATELIEQCKAKLYDVEKSLETHTPKGDLLA